MMLLNYTMETCLEIRSLPETVVSHIQILYKSKGDSCRSSLGVHQELFKDNMFINKDFIIIGWIYVFNVKHESDANESIKYWIYIMLYNLICMVNALTTLRSRYKNREFRKILLL